MSLIECPKCKYATVSTYAEKCPNCNYDIKSYVKKQKLNNSKFIFGWINLQIILGVFTLGEAFFVINMIKDDPSPGIAIWLIVFCFIVGIAALSYGINKSKRAMEYAKQNKNASLGDVISYISQDEKRRAQIASERLKEIKIQEISDEYEQAVASQNSSSPWGKKYFTSPCPYCGHYKVRFATWDDKKMSVAFWGMMSSKVGKAFHCDKCGRTFND